MSGPLRVAAPPARPLLIFDGDCGFCRWWVARWKATAGERFDQAPSQEVASRFPEIPDEAFARAVQLVLPSGEVFEGAEAVFRTLALTRRRAIWLRLYLGVPGFAASTELAYRLIADHRGAATAATRLLWGRSPAPPTYRFASALFLRLLGVIYLAAFVSLWVQVRGLIGSGGILPIASFLDWARGQLGPERYWLLPTLCWIDAGNGFLSALCAGGTAASLLLLVGYAPALCLAVLWALYLSLSVAGQTFLEFQWDLLLLETGFLAIFLAPPVLSRRSARSAPPTRAARLLLVWLLFRLVLSSGAVKLSSGDPSWHALTALEFHYETQPLPPWTAWYMHQLPASFQKLSSIFLFAIELGAPFLYFAPRRLKLAGCFATILLQTLIAATGNYAFFNALAIALCVLLIDDASLPERWTRRMKRPDEGSPTRRWPKWVLVPLAAAVVLVSLVQLSGAFRSRVPWPAPVLRLVQLSIPFRSVNGYGLFAVMTTSRPEIIVEGSADGQTWRAYEFRWKPGDPRRRPRFVAPHQPRLDWQMWFAALGSYSENPWFIGFLGRLLEGSPAVLDLLAVNPFPAAPPRYVRATLYDFRFTDAATRKKTGQWWTRKPIGLYCPVLSREMLRFHSSPKS